MNAMRPPVLLYWDNSFKTTLRFQLKPLWSSPKEEWSFILIYRPGGQNILRRSFLILFLNLSKGSTEYVFPKCAGWLGIKN